MLGAMAGFVLMTAVQLAVGIAATRHRQTATADYLVASRSVHPWLVALATASTNSSGFMFIGLIGETYRVGLSAMWLMVGWIVGDYIAWRLVHRRLRERSQELDASTVASFAAAAGSVAAGGERPLPSVRAICALITIVFLGSYAAAQLTAGGKAVEAVFGWPQATGAILSAGMILGYCVMGGLRASIWTNTAQAISMLGTILMVLAASLWEVGGIGALWEGLARLDPALIDWRPRDARFGVTLFIVSWIVAGIGVLGQPHLVTITMSIRDGDSLKQARPVYFIWYIALSAACILVGLCCRLLLDRPGAAAFDEELALPRLATDLLPPVLVGVVMAGLFSATMSTADTQILCCSSAVSQDLFPGWIRTLTATRATTVVCALATLAVALVAKQSVFELVVLSWSALAAALGPVVVLRTFRCPLTSRSALAVVCTGLATALVWRYGLRLSGSLYEVLPGMAAGFAVYGFASLFGRHRESTIGDGTSAVLSEALP
jgi:sodium/proline symporter